VTHVHARLSDDDERMLRELLDKSREDDEEVRFNATPFRQMLQRGWPLSERQRAWLADVHERVVGTPNYLNMASSGKLARGREVKSMVGPLALRPPVRKVQEDE
jgi:hypothetical protein